MPRRISSTASTVGVVELEKGHSQGLITTVTTFVKYIVRIYRRYRLGGPEDLTKPLQPPRGDQEEQHLTYDSTNYRHFLIYKMRLDTWSWIGDYLEGS